MDYTFWFVGFEISILYAPLFVLVVYFLLNPLYVRGDHAFLTDWRPIPLEPNQIDDSITDYFESAVVEIEQLGFQFLGYYLLYESEVSLEIVRGILINLETNDVANIGPENTDGGPIGLEFNAEFSDGSEILTNNFQCPYVGPMDQRASVYGFKYMPPAQLLRAHSALRAQMDKNSITVPDSIEGILDAYVKSYQRTASSDVVSGFMRHDEENGLYLFTVKGAYRALWPQMFGVRHALRLWRLLADRRALAKAVGR